LCHLSLLLSALPDSSSSRTPFVSIEQVHPERRLDEEALRTLISAMADDENCTLGSITIVLTDHETVLALNRDYLGHDYITDVLSFDLSEAPGQVEGEIYVDLDTAAERCEEFDSTFEEEAHRYVAHGLLHLIGYDDTTPDERAAMRRLENHYLSMIF
jgi:rRNA maturation RNase YbeY